MRKTYKAVLLITVALVALGLAVPAFALPDKPSSMNARFVKWQEKSEVVHILVYEYGSQAVVEAGQPVLFGFEWGGASIEEVNALVAATMITVSIDGDTAMDVSDLQQPAFEAATRSGPAWSWDHDGDGPGDGDGDGIGDWSGPVSFFRYQHPGMASGTHMFDFLVTDADGNTVTDTITVSVVP